MMWEMVGTL